MTTLVRYDPWREMLSLRDAMNRLFDESFVRPFRFGNWLTLPQPFIGTPVSMNVYETPHGYEVQVMLPGIKLDNLDVTVQDNTLTIKGEYPSIDEQGKEGTWLVREIGAGMFQRSITFPKPIDADKIESSYHNGVLTITVPLSEESKPKRISITGGQAQLPGSNVEPQVETQHAEPEKELSAAGVR